LHFDDDVNQAGTTYGPRAKCGPQKLLIWPEYLIFTYFWIDFCCQHYKNWKKLNNLARECLGNIFLARQETELCIPEVYAWQKSTFFENKQTFFPKKTLVQLCFLIIHVKESREKCRKDQNNVYYDQEDSNLRIRSTFLCRNQVQRVYFRFELLPSPR